MGFLERLEQEKLEQKRLEFEAESKELQEWKRKTSEAPVTESIYDQERKSRKCYEESGCELLINKLGKIIGGTIRTYEGNWHSPNNDTTERLRLFNFHLKRNSQRREGIGHYSWLGYVYYYETGLGSYVTFLEWELENDNKLNGIAIETCPNGEIYFHGGLLGSSIIKKNQWRGKGECLEKALDKAYHHPKQRQVDYHLSPLESRGWNS